ncbi:MAG: radical SAM protein [Chloroflexi bacterium]|nr:radical SAM protein [Chloroflexota bacterium]
MSWQAIQQAKKLLATEKGALVRDWGGKLPLVLTYANSYAVGMSSLAMHSLYHWFNGIPGIACERSFAWLSKSPKPSSPPVTLESQRPLREAAVLAVSLSFEMDYFNLVSMLRQAGIPLRAAEREEGVPLVILGGPAVSANPEPLALLADAVVVGELEPVLNQLANILVERLPEGRARTLDALSALPGLYVPSRYHGQSIQRLLQPNLDEFMVASTVRCPQAEFGDLHLIEISRGCEHACRFCLAGCWYLPQRERSLDQIMQQVEFGVKNGQRIGLVAAAVSDYSRMEELLDRTSALGARLSVSSLRMNTLTDKLLAALAASGERTITLAPEAGSERLRQGMHKGINQDDILRAARMTAQYPFEVIKLYFMVGLPGETEGDLAELVRLTGLVRRNSGHNVIVNITPFVPKAHTVWQRQAMAPTDELNAAYNWLRNACAAERITLRAESVRESVTQALLARGDRTLGELMLTLDHPSGSSLAKAAQIRGLDLATYLGAKGVGEGLPWQFIKGTQR